MQGQVLTVEFQPLPESSSDGVSSDSEASAPGTPRSYSTGGRGSNGSVSSSNRAPATPGPANGRSRSPAAGRQHSCSVAKATVPGHNMIVCSPVQWSRDMWVWGFCQHAQRTGAPGFTTVYLHLICGLGLLVLGLWAVWFLGSPCALLCLLWARSRPCRIDLLTVCLCLLCTVSWHPMALAMQTAARPSMMPGHGSLKSAPVGRPVPTPCRMRQHAALRAAEVYVMTAGDVSDSESEDEGCLDKPPVRRVTAQEPRGFLALDRDVGAGDSDPDYWLDPGRLLQATLLRLASVRGDCTAFVVAVALLDVLFEAFPPDAAPPVQRIVSLEESVPITSFQRQALDLQALLPVPLPWCQPAGLVDWLDCDLRMLCGDGQVPATKRALFRQVASWHGRDAALTPRRVLVYTDGSATPVGEATDIAPGAWAVSVWIESAEDSREYLLGCAADVMVTTDDFRFVGAHSDSPLECEQVALVWGLAWIIQYGAALQLPIVVRYDCQAAGLGAFGGAKAPKETGMAQPSGLSLFLCQLRQLACAGALLTHEHVRAHAGHVANELCDELSKQARRLPAACCGDMLPCWPGRLLRHPLREWAWLPHQGSLDMPTLFAFESEADRLQRADLVGPAGPCLGFTGTGPSAQPAELRLCLVTFNVLSLLDPTSGTGMGNVVSGQGMRVIAKREILKRQFLAQDVLLAGLQETRLRDEATLPDKDYFILCAPADARGHFGVSLWASKEVPYARQGGRLLRLQLNYLTVVACEPRLLVVQICAPHFRATVVVAHAPSEPPAPPGAAESFWAKCRRVLQRRPALSDIIVLSDANARVGALPSSSVGGLDPEPENPSGQAFHAFLADMQLWVPATFPECHTGPSSTWWAPSGQGHRLDYVGVPVHWPAACLSTRVWCGFEFLQLRDDHVPTLLAASFVVGRQGEAGGHYVRKAVRPCPGACPVAYGPRLEALKLLPAAARHTGVDEHFSGVASEWRALGNSVCEPASAKPLQTYLTQATMRLVVLRKECRLHLRALKARARRRCLSLWFLGWRAAMAARPWCPSEAVAAMRWVRGLLPWIGRASLLIFRYGRLIRAGAKADRIAYLDGLVQAVSLADLKDPKQLFRQVRAAFPQARSARRPAFTPLPAVLDSNGQLAACAEARFECWRLHFASQEAGEVCQHADYRQVLCDQKGARTRPGTVFDIHCVPTLTAVEQTVAGLPYGKASGYDGLTGELLRLHVPASARVLVPLFTKACLGLHEPVEWRGGALIPLAKRAAAALSCDRFRSILISSVPGKVYHRQLRTLLMPALQRSRADLQAGAVPGISTVAIAMVARAFRDIQAGRHRAWALTFFDVRAAYYRVVRQLLAEVGDTEAALRRLFHDMGVPPTALAELRDRLMSIGTLAEAGAPAHLCEVLADAMQGTWFRLDLGAVLTVTHRGVRPGDSLADVLFGFTLSAYLTATEAALSSAGLSEPMPHTPGCSLWRRFAVPVSVSCGSWADDFVRLTAQTCRRTLTARVTRVVQLFVEQADALGIQLTFAEDKTASLLSDMETQVPPVLSDKDGRYLEVRSAVSGQCHRLPVIDAYKHLGGIATVSGTPVPEIGYRHSLALAVVRPLRARLFSAVGIPLQTRSHLLRSLAMSRYTFGSAALTLHAGIHKRLWAKHYVALWRGLWRRREGEPFRHSYAVLGPAGAPTPPLALALSRAVLLRQITSAGPATLLQLLSVHWRECPRTSWLGQVQGDIEHVSQYVSAARALLGTRVPVESLVEALHDDPCWWVRHVKAACRQVKLDLAAWNRRVHHNDLSHGDGGARPEGAVDATFDCLWCGASFRLRKHLCVHLARTHQIFSPARHLAHGDTCVSCLKCFRTVARHQQHLRVTARCMLRTCLLVPCHSVETMREEEAVDVRRCRQLRGGAWSSFVATRPTLQAQGPLPLTASERLDLLGEDADLGLMSRLFYPDPHFLSWVELFLAERSTEGPRSGTAAFWDKRPLPSFT